MIQGGGIKKLKDTKNSPEMDDSERDLFPVKILSKSVEKQKSYSNFPVTVSFFFDFFLNILKYNKNHLRSDNDIYERTTPKIFKISEIYIYDRLYI